MTKTIDQQIASVERKIGMRQRVYKRWVADGKMNQDQATYETECMMAVHRTLIEVRKKQESLG